MRVDRWAAGRAGGRACRRVEGPLSCLVMLLCLVLSGCFQCLARQTRGSLLRSACWHGMGMAWAWARSLAGPEGSPKRLQHPTWGEGC